MRYGRDACHYCHRREEDPARRLVRIAYTFAPRRSTARALATHITHVDCFLRAGGSIAGLADSQLWHVPTATWQRLGYLPGDSRAEYERVREEERMAASSPSLRAVRGGVAVTRDGGVMGNTTGAHDPSVAEDGDTSPRAKRVGRREERAAATTRVLRRAA